MNPTKLSRNESVLVVIDLQANFLRIIHEADRVVDRALFLCQSAELLGVPMLFTEQYPERMGGTEPVFASFYNEPIAKMEFSAAANARFMSRLESTGRRQVILVGIETHICVSQTAIDLLRGGYEVIVCPDALSASTQDRHKLGMERLRDSGAMPIHTEAVAYEWCHQAGTDEFKSLLGFVKASKF